MSSLCLIGRFAPQIFTVSQLLLALMASIQLHTVDSFISPSHTFHSVLNMNKPHSVNMPPLAQEHNNINSIQKKDHEHADSPVYDALSINTAFSNYRALYAASIQDPSSFWTTQANKYITWFQAPPVTHPALHGDFEQGDFTFFAGGKLNVCYNAIDRHVYERNGKGGSDIAMIWEGDEPTDIKTFTYNELLQQVSRIANALRSQGVQKGDKVTIYMPMIPELPMTMLACARIGAPHSVSCSLPENYYVYFNLNN